MTSLQCRRNQGGNSRPRLWSIRKHNLSYQNFLYYFLSPIFFRLSTTSVKYLLCKRKILDYATNDKKLSSKVINWCIRENCSISFKAHTMSNQNIFLASATLLLFAVSCNAFKISTRDYCPPKPATMAPFDAARVRIQKYFVSKVFLNYCGKNCSSDWENLLKFEAEHW